MGVYQTRYLQRVVMIHTPKSSLRTCCANRRSEGADDSIGTPPIGMLIEIFVIDAWCFELGVRRQFTPCWRDYRADSWVGQCLLQNVASHQASCTYQQYVCISSLEHFWILRMGRNRC